MGAALEVVNEIRLLSTLRHPDLVMFLGACFDHDPPFFITEFMERGDLERHYMAQAAKTGLPFRPANAVLLKWSVSIARALCFLHGCSKPVIHRDLKPLNLLLTRNDDIKVADFGISKLMHSAPEDICAAPYMSGGVGTWRYMAPEVVRHEQYTDRVDIFSFALIIWFMATGRRPFVVEFGEDASTVLDAYLRGQEPRPDLGTRTLGRGFPGSLKRLVEECWHTEPARRPSAANCTRRLADLGAETAAGDESPRSRFQRVLGLKKSTSREC